jgi:hypothetical protein
MTTGAFNDPGGDGQAVSQRLVAIEIGRVLKEIVGTGIDRLTLRSGDRPQWHFGECQLRPGSPCRAGSLTGGLGPSDLVLLGFPESVPVPLPTHTAPQG